MSRFRRSETVISGMIFRSQISVKLRYHSSELQYPYILISASPISQAEVLWYRYILISLTTISGLLGYTPISYYPISCYPISGILRYRRNSDIGARKKRTNIGPDIRINGYQVSSSDIGASMITVDISWMLLRKVHSCNHESCWKRASPERSEFPCSHLESLPPGICVYIPSCTRYMASCQML